MNVRTLSRKRTRVSRIVAVFLMLVFVFTRTEIKNDWIRMFLDHAGLSFITAGALGRIWSSLYICGRKNVQIIAQGPYAAVRNPLYMFSFIGVFGIALSTQNFIFMAAILLMFIIYYPVIIISEEKKLTALHGEPFMAYMRKTPRFFPNLKKICTPDFYEVDVRRFSSAFWDAVWFFIAYIFINGIKFIHAKGLIPLAASF